MARKKTPPEYGESPCRKNGQLLVMTDWSRYVALVGCRCASKAAHEDRS